MSAEYFRWSKELSVNNPLIDRDHQELIALVNELHDCASRSVDPQEAARLVQTLINYTREHFAREELLMEAIDYPELAHHRAQHETLMEHAARLQQAFVRGDSSVIAQMAELLRLWLTSHIRIVDKKLADAVHEAGVQLK